MAPLAGIRRAAMCGGLSAGSRAVMAAGALPRRAFEATTNVARGAVNAEMCTGKREAGGKVIKRSAALRMSRRNNEYCHRQCDEQPQAPKLEVCPSNVSEFVAHPRRPRLSNQRPSPQPAAAIIQLHFTLRFLGSPNTDKGSPLGEREAPRLNRIRPVSWLARCVVLISERPVPTLLAHLYEGRIESLR